MLDNGQLLHILSLIHQLLHRDTLVIAARLQVATEGVKIYGAASTVDLVDANVALA